MPVLPHWWPWIAFSAIVLFIFILDLGVFHRKSHSIGMKEALIWSGVWIGVSILFGIGIAYFYPEAPEVRQKMALDYFTGYIIEKSLSVDNLFVFLVVFSYFNLAPEHQHRVLFWGILGALVLRALFIGAGIALIRYIDWIVYVFGAFLIWTGIKMTVEKDEPVDPGKSFVLRFARRFLPIHDGYVGNHFIMKKDGKTYATTLFIVLIVIETTDVMFALDSIPAILAITDNPFVVYTSNVFAILGLRSLYFALAVLLRLFHHLHYGLAAILVFVGAKMIGAHLHWFEPSTYVSLGVIGGLVSLSILASLLFPEVKEEEEKAVEEHVPEAEEAPPGTRRFVESHIKEFRHTGRFGRPGTSDPRPPEDQARHEDPGSS